MNRIHTLSRQLANQIAAGEVIERPASVLKELIENSIDAGAKKISIRVWQAGKQKLMVTDDGRGIHPDDFILSLARHATSKITSQADLDAIHTLGFRGEALASISACAKVKIQSRTKATDYALQITSAPEQELTAAVKCAHPLGTTVTVENLFFNLPARRKFLRSERTEWLHIEDLFQKVALSHPEIEFSLFHNDKAIKTVPAVSSSQLSLAVKKIMGERFIKSAFPLDKTAVDLSIHGWLGRAEDARSQRDAQFCYINGRMVRDKLVNHAIRQAYEPYLYPGRFPCYVLYIEMNPAAVDVNVHPTKHEVRFSETRLVHDFIYNSIHHVLLQPQEADIDSTALDLQDEPADTAVITPVVQKTELKSAQPLMRPIPQARIAQSFAQPPKQHFEYLGSFANQWLILKSSDELRILNLHASLAERAFIELSQLSASAPVVSTPLIRPVSISLSETSCNQLLATDMLAQWGVTLDRIAPTQIIVRALPYCLRYADSEALVQRFLANYGKLERTKLLHQLCCLAAPESLACFEVADRQALLASLPNEQKAPKCACGQLAWQAFDEHRLQALA